MFMRPFGKPWVIIADARESHDIQMTRKDEFDRSMITGEVFGPIFPENHVSVCLKLFVFYSNRISLNKNFTVPYWRSMEIASSTHQGHYLAIVP